MPYRGRRKGWSRKNRSFSRRPHRSWGRGGNIKITLGERRVWIWNNSEEEVVIRPGQYIELEIIREAETRLGPVLRCNLRRFREAEAEEEEEGFEAQEGPEEREEDWV